MLAIICNLCWQIRGLLKGGSTGLDNQQNGNLSKEQKNILRNQNHYLKIKQMSTPAPKIEAKKFDQRKLFRSEEMDVEVDNLKVTLS